MKSRFISILVCLLLVSPAHAGFFSTFFANVASDALKGGGSGGGSNGGPVVDPLLAEKKIQSSLGVMSFYTGEITGDLDTFESRTGIKAFQTAYGHEPSGILSEEQLKHLTYLSNLFVEVSKPDQTFDRKSGIWREIDATKDAMRVKGFTEEYLSFLSTTLYPLRIATEFDNGEITLTGGDMNETQQVQLKYVQFNLPEGEYTLNYSRLSEDEEFLYTYTETISLVAETNIDVIEANKAETQKRLDRLAKEAKEKAERLAKEAKEKMEREARDARLAIERKQRLESGTATEEDLATLFSQHKRWESYNAKEGSPTFVDPMTQLEWARCSVGQKWIDNSCNGEPSRFKFESAQAAAAASEYAGKSGWRLPTRNELKSLVYCGNGTYEDWTVDGGWICRGGYKVPTIHQEIFPSTVANRNGGGYWTSSPRPLNHSDRSLWTESFYRGQDTGVHGDNFYLSVRLVRSGR